ncbi:hypothetical protein SCLCIDRAFT_1224388 [Scleroderma citrinum Foug A]|uniref:Uncharacterized protein n=1 Tax=Scleroderma citrinum Foug A TaxID=1036808 RepID=A0A0C2ZFF5_9AGAM|nr:hypothetical protein SCLCIDRAFT_1224388 [Scleroderma citrinum Foug A]
MSYSVFRVMDTSKVMIFMRQVIAASQSIHSNPGILSDAPDCPGLINLMTLSLLELKRTKPTQQTTSFSCYSRQ